MRDLQDASRYHGASSIGSYRLMRSLGAGPLSRTYLAEHEAIPKQQFALKIMEAVPLLSTKAQEQAFLEVHRLQDLRHAHVLPILEVWMHERVLCLVTPYAAAGSLRQRLAMSPGSPLPLDTSLALLRQIGEALHFAHQQQMVHANLKPENILLQPDDDSFLADFYLPALMQSEQAVRIRQALGASYMAPEQLLQGKTTPLSDQYSLACVAFELLTGRAPFQADDFEGIARKHLLEMPAFPPRPVRARREPVPLVESVILKALSKQPEERYPDVWEFITALRAPSPLVPGNETDSDQNIPPVRALSERSTQCHADVPTFLAGLNAQLAEGQRPVPASVLLQKALLPVQTLALQYSPSKRRGSLIGLVSLASCVILPFLLAFLMAFSPVYRSTVKLPVSPAGTVLSSTAVTAPQGAQSGATPPFQPPQSAGAPGASPFPSATPKPTATLPAQSPTPLPTPTAPPPAPSPTPLPSPTTPPPPPTPTPRPPVQICAVNYTVNTQWPGGFVVTITITNTGPTLINGWTLAFTFRGDQYITNGWNGAFNQNGETVRIGNAPYNMQIQAGATITLGFQGTWHMSNASPSRFSLNGSVCSAS